MSTRGPKKKNRAPARMLFADDGGRIFDHPDLLALGQSWRELMPLATPLLRQEPPGSQVVFLPGRRPVGLDPDSGQAVVLEEVELEGATIRPHAVAATPPPGYLRHALPAMREGPDAPDLPLRAYTAVGWTGQRVGLAALRIDPRRHWDPDRFDAGKVEKAVSRGLARFGGNALVRQIAHCARDYACCTASNFFLGQSEAALPSSPTCNARCLGCISEQEAGGSPSPQQRLERPVEVDDMVEAAVHHLEAVDGGLVSFGQGCEGEPLTRADAIADAIRGIRRRTGRGGIHMNTNGSRPQVLDELAQAGLQSVRVSLFSARAQAFDVYHRADFGLTQVEQFICRAVELGLVVSLNYLVAPGYHDREEERDALTGLLERSGAHMVQLRNLDMDPERLFERFEAPEGQALGLRNLPDALRRGRAGLRVGSFNPLPEEWQALRATT